MTDFNDLTSIRQHLTTIKRSNRPGSGDAKYGTFEPIYLGDFSVWIRAGGPKTKPGSHNSSNPRKKLKHITLYRDVSIAIEERNPLNSIFVNRDSRFSHFDWSKRWDVPAGYDSHSGAGHVPIRVVCQIIKDVYVVSQNKALW